MIKLDVKKQLNTSKGSMTLEIKLDIAKGEFLTFTGSSGAGKSSLLKMLCGLMKPDQGYIEFKGQTLFSSKEKIFIAPQKRKIGILFQEYSLFPHLNVYDNVAFGNNDVNNKSRIEELLEFTELKGLEKAMPHELSGGQKQRVALARTLVYEPDLLLLDEPLSALDPKMRYKLQNLILETHKRYDLTSIMVSHDSSEILRLSSRVVKINEGKIAQEGTAAEVLNIPSSSTKFSFIGEILEISVQGVIYLLTILIGNQTICVVADRSEIVDLEVGDKVYVGSKAFNPIVKKI